MMMHKRLATNYKLMRNKTVSISEGITLFFQFTKSKSDFVLVLLYLICSVGYLAFVGHQPIQILAYMAHDDAMFWTHAFSIVSGNWLGPYSEMTLPKGVGFPLLEAFGAVSGIPINVLTASILLTALGLLIRALSIFKVNRWLLFVAFLLTLGQSSLLMVRPLRDYLYASLLFIVIAGILELSRPTKKLHFVKFIFLGAFVGLFLLTREENPWILPGVIVCLIGVLVFNKKNSIGLLNTTKKIGVTVSGLAAVHLIVMAINFASYGSFTTQDFTFGSFPKALSALQSVEEDQQTRHILVSKKDRDAIYKVSPTFAELKPFFEGPGLFWTKFGCSIEGESCGEYGGWFSWALRDAIADRGYYQSPKKADYFLSRVTKEIKDACEVKVLKCSKSTFSIIPSFHPNAKLEVVPTVSKILDLVQYKTIFSNPSARSEGDEQTLYLIRAFLGSPKTFPSNEIDSGKINGWAYSPSGAGVKVDCATSEYLPQLTWIDSPDLSKAFDDGAASKSRFQISYKASAHCSLVLTAGPDSRTIPFNEISTNQQIDFGNGKAYIESHLPSLVDKPNAVPSRAKDALIVLDRLINPILLFGGAVALALSFILGLLRQSKDYSYLFIILSLYTLIISRIALITFVHITSFPAISEQYVLPATALIPFAGMLAFHALFQETRNSISRRSANFGNKQSPENRE